MGLMGSVPALGPSGGYQGLYGAGPCREPASGDTVPSEQSPFGTGLLPRGNVTSGASLCLRSRSPHPTARAPARSRLLGRSPEQQRSPLSPFPLGGYPKPGHDPANRDRSTAAAAATSHPGPAPAASGGARVPSWAPASSTASPFVRDPEGQILPSGTGLLPPWPHVGVLGPSCCCFSSRADPCRRAPDTSPSPRGVVGPPSQEALIFRTGEKKKRGMREGGDGDALSLFSFGAGLIQQRSPNGKRQSEHALCTGLGASRRAGRNWGKLGEFPTSLEGVEGSKAPTARAGAAGVLGVGGSRPLGAAVWLCPASARWLRRARCRLGLLCLSGEDPSMRGQEGKGSACCRGGVPCVSAEGSSTPQPPPAGCWPGSMAAGGIWGGCWDGGVLLHGEGLPVPGGHVPRPQLFQLVALGCSPARMTPGVPAGSPAAWGWVGGLSWE